jgi:hypothetical protein
MRNFLIALFGVLFAVSAFAQDAAIDSAVETIVDEDFQQNEFTGILDVSPVDTESGSTEALLVLDADEKNYRLMVADATMRSELEVLGGRTVTVKGKVVAATDAEELDSIDVESWVESEMLIDDEVDLDEEGLEEAPDAE